MRVVSGARRLQWRIVGALACLGGVAIACLLLLICVEVLARYFLHRPMGWVIPVVEYSVVVITFFAVAWLERQRRHIRIEILLQAVGTNARRLLERVTAVISPLVTLVLTVAGIRVVVDLASRDIFTEDLLEVPMAPLVAVIPLGLALLFVEQVRHALTLWRNGAAAGPADSPESSDGRAPR